MEKKNNQPKLSQLPAIRLWAAPAPRITKSNSSMLLFFPVMEYQLTSP